MGCLGVLCFIHSSCKIPAFLLHPTHGSGTLIKRLAKEQLEKEIATHSSIFAWKILWTEEPGGLQYVQLQRVGHNWVTNTQEAVVCTFWCEADRKQVVGKVILKLRVQRCPVKALDLILNLTVKRRDVLLVQTPDAPSGNGSFWSFALFPSNLTSSLPIWVTSCRFPPWQLGDMGVLRILSKGGIPGDVKPPLRVRTEAREKQVSACLSSGFLSSTQQCRLHPVSGIFDCDWQMCVH